MHWRGRRRRRRLPPLASPHWRRYCFLLLSTFGISRARDSSTTSTTTSTLLPISLSLSTLFLRLLHSSIAPCRHQRMSEKTTTTDPADDDIEEPRRMPWHLGRCGGGGGRRGAREAASTATSFHKPAAVAFQRTVR